MKRNYVLFCLLSCCFMKSFSSNEPIKKDGERLLAEGLREFAPKLNWLSGVEHYQFLREKTQLAIAQIGGGVVIVDPKTKKPLRRFWYQDGVIMRCFAAVGEDHVAGGRDDGTIKIFPVSTIGNLFTIYAHKQRVTALRAVSGNRLLSSSREEKTVKAWDLESRKRLYTLSCFDQDVTFLGEAAVGLGVVGFSNDSAIVFDLSSGRKLYTIPFNKKISSSCLKHRLKIIDGKLFEYAEDQS